MAEIGLQQWFSRKLSEIDKVVQSSAREAAQTGEEITKHNIEISGTVKSGKRGRIETGEMRDRVTSDYKSDGEMEATAKFGWLSGDGPEKYQEYGFAHVGGVTVDGMYSLADARDEVVQNLRDELERGLRGL